MVRKMTADVNWMVEKLIVVLCDSCSMPRVRGDVMGYVNRTLVKGE